MPSKKKKYNARFPAGRIKKIMQTDEEVGKVAQAVPVIISKALEMFIESLLKKSMQITHSRNAKTLTPSHMKQCILSESRFDFLKDLVKNIPDASVQEDNENNALADLNVDFGTIPDDPAPIDARSCPSVIENTITPPANFYNEQSTSSASITSRTPVIQFGPQVNKQETKYSFSVNNLLSHSKEEPKLHITIDSQELTSKHTVPPAANHSVSKSDARDAVPHLVPLLTSAHGQSSTGENLCIDEDYDN